MNRREILGGIGTGTVLGSAGCLGSIPNLDGGSDGPEDVVEQYTEAIEKDNLDAAADLIHPDSNLPSPTESDDVPVDTIEERPLSEIWIEFEDDEEEINETAIEASAEKQENDLSAKFEESGLDDHAFVYVSYSSGPVDEFYFTMVKDDGEWYIYQ